MPTTVIKQSGQRDSEPFELSKLHKSITAACLSVRSHAGEAEAIAHDVCRSVALWLEQKPEVTSRDLRHKATEALFVLHPEAAYLYQHHQFVL